MAQKTYEHRSVVQKLGIKPGERLEIAGDVGTGVRKDVKDALGRGLVRSGELDGAIVGVASLDEAHQTLVTYRARLKDTGFLWLVTPKRGQEGFFPQMSMVPFAKKIGLIDNKTISVDDERSGIRFVVPRALRKAGEPQAE